MVKENILDYWKGKEDFERDLYLVMYGMQLERMNQYANLTATLYEDYLRLSFNIEAKVRLEFKSNKRDYNAIIEPYFNISFEKEEDKERYEELINENKKEV